MTNKAIYTLNVPTKCVPTLSHQLSQPKNSTATESDEGTV